MTISVPVAFALAAGLSSAAMGGACGRAAGHRLAGQVDHWDDEPQPRWFDFVGLEHIQGDRCDAVLDAGCGWTYCQEPRENGRALQSARGGLLVSVDGGWRVLKPGGSFVIMGDLYRTPGTGSLDQLAMGPIGAAALFPGEDRDLLTSASHCDDLVSLRPKRVSLCERPKTVMARARSCTFSLQVYHRSGCSEKDDTACRTLGTHTSLDTRR